MIYSLRRLAARAGRLRQSKEKLSLPQAEPGISVIIPERDNPRLLNRCLKCLQPALERMNEPCQVIVVTNGAPPGLYRPLYRTYPDVEWIHVTEPLGFSAAIARGIEIACHDWVFLLNNDMTVDPDSLYHLAAWRLPWVFSAACQIFFEDRTRRREETGLTGIRIDDQDVHLFDRNIDVCLVTEHLYSGGGASLFRKSLLEVFLKQGKGYDPFYWEDVDWGVRAGLSGYVNLFIPQAKVRHLHRATVKRFYKPDQVMHIFNRNKWIFYLRFGLKGVHPFWLGRKIRDLGRFNLSTIKDLMEAACQVADGQADLKKFIRQETFYFPAGRKKRNLPWLVLVVPFSLLPPVHGSAVRILNLYRHLSDHYNIWLVSDEGSLYQTEDLDQCSFFSAVSLLRTPRPEMGDSRNRRMDSHARADLRRLLNRVIDKVKPAIVQIEHEELCELVNERRKETLWALSLHDVSLGTGEAPEKADRRLMAALSDYDQVFTCSREDNALLPHDSICIENGVNPGTFNYQFPSSGCSLIFVGPFRYTPNRRGIESFIENVWTDLRKAYPDVKLRILAGLQDSSALAAENSLFRKKGIELVDMTRRVADYLARATLVINPLRDIRGSCLKTIEALACGRLCISFQDAARGLEQYGFSGLKTAEDWGSFRQIIETYLADEPLRRHEERLDIEKLAGFHWKERADMQHRVYKGKYP